MTAAFSNCTNISLGSDVPRKRLSFSEIPPDEKIIDEIKRTLAANKMRDGVHIRLTLTRGVKITSGMDPRLNQAGPTLIVLAEHKPPVYAKTGLDLDHEQDAPAAAGDPRSAEFITPTC